jgi:hypothetical protein
MKRTLSLHRETLTDISADELSDVVGGQITNYCGSLHFWCTSLVKVGTVMHC